MTKEKLFMGVVHEIKNTTATINGFLQLLVREVRDKTRARRYVNILASELDHLGRLIEDGLYFSWAGDIPLGKCDLAAILKRITDRAACLAQGSGIEIKVNTNPCPAIYGVPELLQHLLWNLVANALAALPDSGEILLELEPVDANWLRLICRDTGIGIPAADIDHIFRPYFSTKKTGTGLGLPLCKRIAEFHGGRLEVESDQGGGTSFILWLPVQRGRIKNQ